MAFLDETGLAELWSLVRAKDIKFETGSYTGAGVYGSKENANSLTFGFTPKMVFVYGGYQNGYSAIQAAPFYYHTNGYKAIVSYPPSPCYFRAPNNTIHYGTYWWEGNTLYWFSKDGNAAVQLNEAVGNGDNGRGVYHYIALGWED